MRLRDEWGMMPTYHSRLNLILRENMDKEYILVKRSQVVVFQKTALYYFSKDGEPLLYKQEGESIDSERLVSNQYPDLFIHVSDRERASRELYDSLTDVLAKAIFSKGIVAVRKALGNIINEALTGPLDVSLEVLPDTLEVMFEGYSRDKTLLDSIHRISSYSSQMVEHIINILSLTLQFCFFHRFTDADGKQLGMCAIFHDIGCTQIDRSIVESNVRLTDSQFEVFKTHTSKGYKILKTATNYENVISLVALEHHEKLDGSGYPSGKKHLSEASQLVGLIDSYEPLTYRSKKDRPAHKAFDSLQILKNEVMAGQYDKSMFKNFCSCLTR